MCRSIIIFAAIILFVSPLFGQGKWTPLVKNINGNFPNGAAFLNEQYGFVSTLGGTYRTTDGGKTWVHTNLPVNNFGRSQFYFYTPSNLFFGGSLESIDSGMTWKVLPQQSDGLLYIKNGIFFDATGRISRDHARSWKIIDSNFLYGQTVAGNLDSSIAMWGGGIFGLDKTLYSTDLGNTWQYGGSGKESDFGYCIPYTQTYFRSGGDGVDVIERSDDGGANWQILLGPVYGEYLSDGFGGSGCILYAQTMDTTDFLPSGLLRSQDLGQTWAPVGGPVRGDGYPLGGVMNRGAVCIAMSYRKGEPVWKYVDSSIMRPVFWDTKISRSFADTLYINECDSVRLGLNLDFLACDYIRFHDLKIDGLAPKNYKINFKKDNLIRSGHPDSAQIIFTSIPAGTFTFGIHLSVMLDDWSTADTVLPLTVNVTANPAELKIDRHDTLDFGTQGFCNAGGKQDIHLSNLSCRSLKVTSARLEMDSLAKYDFSVVMNPSQIILKEGIASGRITVNFQPQSPGIKTGKLIIFTSIGNDTINIIANVLPEPKTLIVACDSMRSPICSSTDGVIHLYNKSCRVMTVDSVSLPNPYQLLPVRLPVILLPGDSGTLPVRFTPSGRGESLAASEAKLSFYMPFETETFYTTLPLAGVGTHGPSAFSVSADQIRFDTLHICDSGSSTHITLYSIGCDSLSLNLISFSGDSVFSFSEDGKRDLAVGDSISLNVKFDPISKGNKSAVITITKNDGTTQVIPISATVLRSVRLVLQSTPNNIDFGMHLTCESSDTIITLQNPSCDEVIISGVRWQVAGVTGLGFGVVDTFPIVIPPGGSKNITIRTVLDTTGGINLNSASLEILHDADNNLQPVSLMRSYIIPHPVHLWLTSEKKPLTSGDAWTLKLKGIPNELTDIGTINFSLNYNTDLLEFLQSQSSANSADGKAFIINGSPTVFIDNDSTIATMKFVVYLTKETSSSIALNSIALNVNDPKYMSCVAFPLSTGDVDFTYLNGCTDQGIRGFLQGKAFQYSVHPNPVQGEILVDIESSAKEETSLEIFDALGVRMKHASMIMNKGRNSVSIDTHDFAPGMYVVRIGNISQTFVKVR